MADGHRERIDVVLVVGGLWHDFDFARLELLEAARRARRVPRPRASPTTRTRRGSSPTPAPAESWSPTRATCARPQRAQQVIRDWVEARRTHGGAARHELRARSDARRTGRAPRDLPLWVDTLGSQFVAHPPIAPYRVENVAPDHWLVAGVEPFEADRRAVPQRVPRPDALHAAAAHDVSGRRPRIRRERLDGTRPDHLVMYLRPLGAGAVLYNTLGHCRGHYDMVPLKDYYPNVDRCSWELPGVLRAAAPLAALGAAARQVMTDRRQMELTREDQLDLHRRMVRIRLFEEAAGKLMRDRQDARLPAPVRRRRRRSPSGVCERSRSTTTSPRPTAATATSSPRAATSTRMMAELMGKATGYCKGKGGSMHINDLDARHARRQRHRRRRRRRSRSVPAFANKYRGSDQVAGRVLRRRRHQHRRVPRGRQHGLRAAPAVVFVCENNEYGEFTAAEQDMAITDVVDRAAGYGMPGVIVDGMDVARRPRGGRRGGRARPPRRGAVADRGQDVPLLQPPRRPEPRASSTAPTTRSRRGRSATRSSPSRTQLIEHGCWRRRDELDATWAEIRADIDGGDRVRRGQPVPRRADQLLVDVYHRSAAAAHERRTQAMHLRATRSTRRSRQAMARRRRRVRRRRGRRRVRRRVPHVRRPAGRVRRAAASSTRRSASRRSSASASAPRSPGCGRSST